MQSMSTALTPDEREFLSQVIRSYARRCTMAWRVTSNSPCASSRRMARARPWREARTFQFLSASCRLPPHGLEQPRVWMRIEPGHLTR